jgi:hypothetical protein
MRATHHPRLLAALGVLLAAALAAVAAAQPVVYFSGKPYCAEEPGDRFLASIWLDTAGESVSCFHLYLTYNRSRLDLLSAVEGEMFDNSGFGSLFIWEDPEADTTGFTDCLLGPGASVSGIGEIVQLEFELTECAGPMVSPIILTENRALPPPFQIAFLTDEDRQVIPGVQYLDSSAELCGTCIAAAGGGAVPAAPSGIQLAPNPVGRELRVRWRLGGADTGPRPLVFEVLDSAGRRQRARMVTGGPTGELQWDLGDGSPLPRGVYWLVLRSGDGRLVRKFVHDR